MSVAIITDSTCDLTKAELEGLGVQRVHLYVHFKGETLKDWIDITPKQLVEGVQGGAATPSTSQPSPQDFENAYRAAVDGGATEIVCITISSGLSGTYQSANIAKENAGVPVVIIDSKSGSLGVGALVKRAAKLRDEGKSAQEIGAAIQSMADRSTLLFSVGTLEFLQKNGRIGSAGALLGSLLSIKPILGLDDGKVVPRGKARGAKKALKEMVDKAQEAAAKLGGRPLVHFLHVQDVPAAEGLRSALREGGVDFEDGGIYELGAVIATHVGPGTSGFVMHPRD